MQAASRADEIQRCRNCDARATKLGRLVVVSPSGRKLHLSVCRFCYSQLAAAQKLAPPVPRR